MMNAKPILDIPAVKKKEYIKPDITHETLLETKAGTPIPPNPGLPPVPGFSGDYQP
jgi:hypothetical protein